MRVYTTDGQSYEVNYIELWSDKENVKPSEWQVYEPTYSDKAKENK